MREIVRRATARSKIVGARLTNVVRARVRAAAMPWVIMMGRYVVGVGVGMSAVVVPQYVAELACTSRRGQLTAMFEFVLCFGMLASTLMNTVLSPLPGTHQPLSPSNRKRTCERSFIRAHESACFNTQRGHYKPRATGCSMAESQTYVLP